MSAAGLERRACRVPRQHRLTQRRIPRGPDDEDRLVADMIALARRCGGYDYRRIAYACDEVKESTIHPG